jgi:hypothetical protein
MEVNATTKLSLASRCHVHMQANTRLVARGILDSTSWNMLWLFGTPTAEWRRSLVALGVVNL